MLSEKNLRLSHRPAATSDVAQGALSRAPSLRGLHDFERATAIRRGIPTLDGFVDAILSAPATVTKVSEALALRVGGRLSASASQGPKGAVNWSVDLEKGRCSPKLPDDTKGAGADAVGFSAAPRRLANALAGTSVLPQNVLLDRHQVRDLACGSLIGICRGLILSGGLAHYLAIYTGRDALGWAVCACFVVGFMVSEAKYAKQAGDSARAQQMR